MAAPLHVAELGGGAHPDRYHQFFDRLLSEPKGQIDWVDISSEMLDLAQDYLADQKYERRIEIIKFIKSDILAYLDRQEDNKLDLALMKYTLDHIKDPGSLFKLLSHKLKPHGKLVATLTTLKPELKAISTNARFLLNGEEFPVDETRPLKDGDEITIKFFKESGHPEAGYLENAETIKYYYSPNTLKKLAGDYGFEISLGDWKEIVPVSQQDKEDLDQTMLVLRKK